MELGKSMNILPLVYFMARKQNGVCVSMIRPSHTAEFRSQGISL